jgi:Icc protein
VGRIDNGDLLSVLAQDGRVRGYAFGHIHHGATYGGAALPLLSAPATCFEFAQGGERFGVETRAPGCRTFELGADGRLSSEVVRADDCPVTPNLAGFH